LISLVSKIGTRNAATGVAGNLQGSEIQDIPIADIQAETAWDSDGSCHDDRSTVDALPKFIGSTLAIIAF
jgi:hypothetical protein